MTGNKVCELGHRLHISNVASYCDRIDTVRKQCLLGCDVPLRRNVGEHNTVGLAEPPGSRHPHRSCTDHYGDGQVRSITRSCFHGVSAAVVMLSVVQFKGTGLGNEVLLLRAKVSITRS